MIYLTHVLLFSILWIIYAFIIIYNNSNIIIIMYLYI